MAVLTAEQVAVLAGRFPFFDLARCSPVLADSQPQGGLVEVRGQGTFPAVELRNGATWFPSKLQRPVNKAGAPLKVRAPKGVRPILLDTPEPGELVVVEGEGALLALLSIGMRGVACAGGTNGIGSKGADGRRVRASTFAGKDVRVFFDADEEGRKGASTIARLLLESGAARVAVVHPPLEGHDPEDWLATFSDMMTALSELQG
ncbi:MAG: toprim domain-containing protein, partial [Myxococcaceae bacterium]|nr:toprim domain-containing protein [Myxococcaceae bacterium]